MNAIAQELHEARPCVSGIGYGVATTADFEKVPLHPEEARLTTGMLPRRRREFWMGRAATHRALQDLGIADGPVLYARRRPSFPLGLIGSLSHSGDAAVAVVSAADRFASLGIDLELRLLPVTASRLVLAPEEYAWANRSSDSCAEAFSAKEAAFKALDSLLCDGAPPLRQILLEPVAGGFKARLRKTQAQIDISICRLSMGILAWTAISLIGDAT